MMDSTIARMNVIIGAVDSASPTINGILGKLGKLAAVGGAIAGITWFGKESLNAWSQFEQRVANVSTLLPEGVDAMEKYGDALREMAKELPVKSVNELADGLYQVLSASVPAEHALDVLKVSAKAAAAGMTDTFTAVDAITTVLNAYKMPATEAAKVSDWMFQTVKRGKTTFKELANSIGFVIPAAAQLGVKQEELFAGFATLTRNGLDASETATALNAALMALLKPSDAMRKKLHELGFESGSAAIKALGFHGTLMALAESVGHNEEEMAKLFPNVRALRAVFPLTGANAKDFAQDLEALTESAGSTEVAFSKVADTTVSKLQLLKNRWEDFKISVGEKLAPAFLKAMDVVQGFINFLEAIFKGDWKTVEKMWNEAWNNFTKAAGEWWETSFKPWLAKLPERIWNVLCGLADIITKINNFFGDKFSEWADTLWNIDTFSIGKDIADKLLNGLHDVIFGTEETESLGETIGESMENGYLAAIGHFWISLIKLVASIGWTLLRFVSGFFYGIGEAMVGALWDGICGMKDWIIDKMTKFGGWILDGIKEGLGPLSWVIDEIGKLGNGMIDAIKKTFDAHSPSRVMIRIGRSIVEGLHIGLNSIKPTIPTPEMPRVTYPEYSGYGGMGIGERSIIFSGDIHIHGVQNMDEFMDELERRFAVVR